MLVHNQGGQRLPIEIFPARLTDEGLKSLTDTNSKRPQLMAFWKNLKEGYDYFEAKHQLPHVKTRPDGVYTFFAK